jgi:L,D-transpeptidase catalytic domain
MTRYLATLAITGLVTLVTLGPAKSQRAEVETGREVVHERQAGTPVMAVVALAEQRVTIYDVWGKILLASISTGQAGYETPVGIYSVLQKEAEHYSNLYDDASMPFMQRLTWSGIALHAGALPGYPASHGCVRMPHAFAEQLFDLTKLGMRVVVVRSDIAPVEISHSALFRPGSIRGPVLDVQLANSPLIVSHLKPDGWNVSSNGAGSAPTWRSIAAATAAAVDATTKKAEAARQIAAGAHKEASRFLVGLLLAEAAKKKAELELQEAERMLGLAAEPPTGEQAGENLKARALEALAKAKEQINALKAEGQSKIDVAMAARDAFRAAEVDRVAAENEARLVESKMMPVSVLISRKMQRLYIRQAFQQVFEGAVTIQDPDRPIGTTLFTALRYTDDYSGLHWSALTMYAKPRVAPDHRSRDAAREPMMTNVAVAEAALGRISIEQGTLDRINEVISPGSSFIITDEAASQETSRDTDFIVLLSGEPQGGIKIRKRNPYSSYDELRGPWPATGKRTYSW